MRLFRKVSLVLSAFLATFAVAQTLPPNTFKHIIIIVQENRTPDNLFGASPASTAKCGQENNPLIAGADIDNGGYGYINGTRQLICNMPLPLSGYDSQVNTSADPDHDYNMPPKGKSVWGWVADYDNGAMDGFCHEFGNSKWDYTCPSYSFVPLGDQHGDIAPYFQIAKTYSFGNYMFQTNQGPSFEAHQFLLTGTSAPVAPGVSPPYDLDFVAELTGTGHYGCTQTSNFSNWVYPDGSEHPDRIGSECYAHDTLVTAAAYCKNGYCDRPDISWGYYAPKASTSSIWIAPLANPQTCYGQASKPSGNPACGTGRGTEFGDHVHLAGQNGYDQAPIFDDLYGCNLPMISWVIPDFSWSDHANGSATSSTVVYGPSWVGDIIDGVGQACGGMYWDTTKEPTAVIVTWDDWGGWYDHLLPWAYYRGTSDSCPTSDAPNGWGCGYVSGFRVPLLVVSPYTGTGNQQTGYSGYVSGACGASPLPSCPNNVFPYVHDFGSILAFTEYNFGMSNITYPEPYYADYNAPDWGSGHSNIPLSDFFGLYPTTRPFVSINTDKDYKFFEGANSGDFPGSTYPADPDDDTESD
jgi:phospholipase C